MTYKDRANTPTEALALDILNAYFVNTYGPGHQVAHWPQRYGLGLHLNPKPPHYP